MGDYNKILLEFGRNKSIDLNSFALNLGRNYNDMSRFFDDLDLEQVGKKKLDYDNIFLRLYVENLALKYAIEGTNNPEQKKFLDNFTMLLVESVNKNNISFFDSICFLEGNIKHFIKDESILKKYETMSEKSERVLSDVFKKIKDGRSVSSKVKTFYCKILLSKVLCANGSLDKKYKEMLDYMLKEILSADRETIRIEKELLLNYLSYLKCSRLNIPFIKVYLVGDEQPYAGRFLAELEIIAVREVLDYGSYDKKSYNLVSTVMHELQHYYQHYSFNHGILNLENYIFAKLKILRSDKKFDEYKTNYYYKEAERNANAAACADLINLLCIYRVAKKKDFETIFKKLQYYNRELSLGIQEDEEGKKRYIVNYNIEEIGKQIVSNPKFLWEFPIMGYFYNEDGSLKELSEIVKQLSKVYKEGSSRDFTSFKRIISEYIEYTFSTKGTTSLAGKKLSKEERKLLVQLIMDNIVCQLDKIVNMYEYLDNCADEDIIRAEIEKKKKIVAKEREFFVLNHKKLIALFESEKVAGVKGASQYQSIVERIIDGSYFKAVGLDSKLNLVYKKVS